MVGELRPVSAFDGLRDPDERSVALFEELGRVLVHPRCANCHPSDDQPRQGMDQLVHDPPVWRGVGGVGVPGQSCDTCHQAANSTISRVPGAPGWRLASAESGWLGRSPAAICALLSDPERNGGWTLDGLQQHLANDPLIGWGWAPGRDREPAPGSQALAAELARAWIDSGARCPEEAP